jgi:hypothetical protein
VTAASTNTPVSIRPERSPHTRATAAPAAAKRPSSLHICASTSTAARKPITGSSRRISAHACEAGTAPASTTSAAAGTAVTASGHSRGRTTAKASTTNSSAIHTISAARLLSESSRYGSNAARPTPRLAQNATRRPTAPCVESNAIRVGRTHPRLRSATPLQGAAHRLRPHQPGGGHDLSAAGAVVCLHPRHAPRIHMLRPARSQPGGAGDQRASRRLLRDQVPAREGSALLQGLAICCNCG